jgi:neutral ceramidase
MKTANYFFVLCLTFFITNCDGAKMGVKGGSSGNGGLGTKPQEPKPTDAPVAPPDLTVLAGIKAAPFALPDKMPLAGYGGVKRRSVDVFNKYPYATWFKPNKGVHLAPRVKAMVLRHNNELLFWVSLDVFSVQKKFREDLIAQLAHVGVNASNLILAATHTHSGPGAFQNNEMLELLAMDRFHPGVYQTVLQQTRDVVLAAAQDLRKSTLHHVHFASAGLQAARAKGSPPVDTSAELLLIKTDGQWRGGLVHYGVHGTAMPAKSVKLSADISGAIESHLQTKFAEVNRAQEDVVFMHSQGALGDVKPSKENTEGLEVLGAAFTAQTFSALPTASPVAPEWQVVTDTVALGQPQVRLGNCTDNDFVKKSALKDLAVNLKKWLPQTSDMMVVKLGPVVAVTWPGEPTSAVGFQAKAAAAKLGVNHVWNLSLANDYAYYFTSPEEYEKVSPEACQSFYGKNAGLQYVKAFEGALARLQK